jgi:hypothetical protein
VGLPDKYEDWRLPEWLTNGEDIDPDRVGRLIFNARKEEEKLKGQISDKDTEITQLKSDVADAKASKAGTDEDAQNELKTLRKKVTELEGAGSKARPQDQKRIDQLEVALSLGLSAADSKRLVGETREEIEADAKTFAKDHGIEVPGDGGNDDDLLGSTGEPPRRQPVPAGRYGTGSRNSRIVAMEDPAKIELPPINN